MLPWPKLPHAIAHKSNMTLRSFGLIKIASHTMPQVLSKHTAGGDGGRVQLCTHDTKSACMHADCLDLKTEIQYLDKVHPRQTRAPAERIG